MARSGLTVDIEGFAKSLSHLVEVEIDRIDAGSRKAVQKGGKATVESIKSSGAFNDITGEYRNGWRYKTEGSDLEGYVCTVYNASKPGLAHLIEKGHGGPHPAGAHPHIEPAFKEGVKVFEAELKKEVSG